MDNSKVARHPFRSLVGLAMIMIGTLFAGMGLILVLGYMLAEEDNLVPLLIELAVLGAVSASLIACGFRLVKRPSNLRSSD